MDGNAETKHSVYAEPASGVENHKLLEPLKGSVGVLPVYDTKADS